MIQRWKNRIGQHGICFEGGRYYKILDNPNCSVISKPDGSPAPALPTSHTQYLSFLFSIFLSASIGKKDMNPITLIFLGIMVLLTAWSRIFIGCKENIKQVIYEIIFGLFRGAIYFYFIADKWNSVEKGKLERESCDLGYKNYKCSTIKDGVVIVKKQDKELQKSEEKCKKKEDEGEEQIYDKYYDSI